MGAVSAGATPFIFGLETVRRGVPASDAVADHFARRQRHRWFALHMGDRRAENRAAAHFTR